jgi:hypothetical protein
MHNDSQIESIEAELHAAFTSGGSEADLPEAIRAGVADRRARRRGRQLVGASAMVVVVASAAALWLASTIAPVRPQSVNPGPLVVSADDCDDMTILGLMRCNARFEDSGGGEIALSDNWDLGWVGRAPALEPGDL